MVGIIGTALVVIIAVAAAAAVVLFRKGSLRSLGRWYLDGSVPLALRRLPFFPLPVGAFAWAVLLLLVTVEFAANISIVVMMVAMMLVMGIVGAATWLALMPPDWLKPAWLRDAETAALAEWLASERQNALEPILPAVTIEREESGAPALAAPEPAGAADGEVAADVSAAPAPETERILSPAARVPAAAGPVPSNWGAPRPLVRESKGQVPARESTAAPTGKLRELLRKRAKVKAE